MSFEDFLKKAKAKGKGKAFTPPMKPEADDPEDVADGGDDEETEDDSAPSQEEVAAAKEFMRAVASPKGDPVTVAMALKNFMKECGY